jgi:ribosomal protein L16/L10AE
MTTTTTSTTSKVRNYQGSNKFLLNLKSSLERWGQLTPKQMESAEKALKGVQTINVETMSDDLKKIINYDGPSEFVNDIKIKFKTYGTLSDKQISASLKQIQKEVDKANTVKLRIPTPGETVTVGRKIGQQMKEAYGLKFNPMIIDITKLLAVSPKAIKFSGKMTTGRNKVCRCCAKTLTDEFSMLTGVGKTCANHMRIPYITDKSQADRFLNDYLRRVEEIGEMEFWVPKSQVKKWEGKTEVVLQMI